MRFRLLVSTLLVSGMALSACGDSSTELSTSSKSDAKFNDADVTFARNMIPHHQQAVEMAVTALEGDRGASPAVKDLAERIKGAQQPEIDLMTGWLTSWGKETMPPMEGMDHSTMDGMEGMDHSSAEGMEGMMTAEEMASLEAASGASFNKAWMEMMVKHHEGALTMAKAVQAKGASPEVRELAGKIVTGQEAEIVEMKAELTK